jgi:hypothetical protein
VRKLAIAILLMSSPATAETITIVGPAPVPGASNPAPVDAPCYPLGKTDDGHFVYSMDCKNLPQAQPSEDTNGAAASGNTPPKDNK